MPKVTLEFEVTDKGSAVVRQIVGETEKAGGMASPEDIRGFNTMAQQIGQFLQIMASNDEEKPKVKAYADRLKVVMNLVKAFEKRFMQAAEARQGQNGQGGPDPKDVAKIAGEELKAKQKVKQMGESHAARTAQRQVSFDMEQQRKDRETNAEIRRENAKAVHEAIRDSTARTPFAE